MIGQRSANASGQGGGQGAPPTTHLPAHRSAPAPESSATPSNVGLSSTGSRPGNTAPAQAAEPKPPEGNASPAGSLSPEQMQKEIAGLFAAGKAQIQRSDFEEAVATFSKILDLDPANLEAKEHLDEAAGKVLEQKKLEEDLQTGKQFFVEKDYESALRKFYRLPKDRHLGEVDLFIRNAWFNWAVVSLKGGNCVEALQRLEENLTLHPDDQEAAKLREVAEHYRDRPKDKVFYAYVDRLTYRTLNQK
jgi:tetratricopeptide (TPR) repeat protein